MQIFFIIVELILLIINLAIVYTDIRYKKIPNRYLRQLLLVLPVYYIGLFLSGFTFDYIFFVYFILSFLISFLLYYYGVWGAGDAKYLLVLSLFLPKYGIIAFLGNVGWVLAIYFLIFFIYFNLKLIVRPRYSKSLFSNIYTETKDKVIVFLKHPNPFKENKLGSLYIITKYLLYFLIFFIFLRLLRGDIIIWIKNLAVTKKLSPNAGSNAILGTFILSLSLAFFYRKIIDFCKKFYIKYLHFIIFEKFSEETVKYINLFLVIFALAGVLILDYMKSGKEVFHRIYLIMTAYLLLYLFIKLLFYSIKLTFMIGEQRYIHIDDLEIGEIVDKDTLVKLFSTQKCLGYSQGYHLGFEEYNDDSMLGSDPETLLNGISNPIDKETCDLIKNIYRITNEYHLKENPNYIPQEEIKILLTFPLGMYIFIGFVFTFFYGDIISRTFVLKLSELVNHYIFKIN